MNDVFLNFLGIALRAGKIISGTELTLQGIRNQSVKLVIMASDCSDRTKKDLTNKTNSYAVPLIDNFTSQELKRSIGKERKVIGVTDLGIARRLIEIMEN
ncbi:ribosomal L7Ae/L30e/S12e/Gadd45 family protein [Companilactobacillus allii]|uniref:50S ribosomal protein L7 n=1 Tax=Companilactobacillus allii TaxID=1847728 RepID=A0A1P8Q455_9LACO|nr:ribosomal L7Ae/L30e/S12e/Gadd45 family protein [Companilactobacillus allii]APX72635.1 50S ribosomal protein L7 [Companilactobacillus allii]USQ69738.1 ribosomal L7Ae/L30e/S12e/Gadd45 family protein [Companilactobacillus allii]